MALRFARSAVLMAGLLALPAGVMALPPTPPPQPHVNPLAGQQKAVHDAQTNLDTARKELLVIRKRVESTFVSKPEYKSAKEANEKAKNDFDAETRKAAANLEKDPAYIALKDKRDKAQATIDQSHAPVVANTNGDDPVKLTDEQIDAAVKDHQEAVLAMLNMQKHAESSDPNFAALQQKRQEATTAWDAIQAQVDEALKADPAYPPAQQNVEQAEQQLKASKDALAAASKSQRQASQPPPAVRPR